MRGISSQMLAASLFASGYAVDGDGEIIDLMSVRDSAREMTIEMHDYDDEEFYRPARRTFTSSCVPAPIPENPSRQVRRALERAARKAGAA